jgi:hypothetical protein
MSRRAHISDRTGLAAALMVLGEIPYDSWRNEERL